MSDSLQPVPSLRGLSPYSEIRQPWWWGGEGLLNLSWNAAVCPPSPRVKQRLQEFLEEERLQQYPDVTCRALTAALAEYCETTPERLLVFNGSDSALEYACRAFVAPGDQVVMAAPTYDNTRVYAQSLGGDVVMAYGEDPFVASPDVVLAAASQATRCVYIVNPNNPTGTTWEPGHIDRVCAALPQALVIVDEAYIEFGGQTSIPLLPQHPNLLVARTFSKAFALAGLRCGYLVGGETVLAPIRRIRVGKNVNTLAQVAALAALEDADHMRRYVAATREGGAWLAARLRERGFDVRETVCNFILVDVGDPDAVKTRLEEEQGLFVRSRSGSRGLETCIRISTGPRDVMARCLEAWDRTFPAGDG